MPRRQIAIPPLNFPDFPYGTGQVPLDLAHHLYRGLSGANANNAALILASSKAGELLVGRLGLVTKLHAALRDKLAEGQQPISVRNICKSLRYFFAWCDDNGRLGGESSAIEDYRDWSEYLFKRVRTPATHNLGAEKPASSGRHGKRLQAGIKAQTAHDIAAFASLALTDALGMNRPAIRYTRLPALAAAERTPYSKAEKVSFETASDFGRTLLQICDRLTLESALGRLPVTIELDDGIKIVEWCKLLPPEKVRALQGLRPVAEKNVVLKTREAWEKDGTIRTRYPVVNLRIECELLIFISQTGMNLAQAHKLKRQPFRYQSAGDDVLVTTYKDRRGGAVKFPIYKEYRPLFKRYLKWIDHFVSVEEDDRLFPFYYPSAIPAQGSAPNFSSTRLKFAAMGREWVGPQKLRNLRVNWIRSRTGNDLLAAESAQHTAKTLRTIYTKPTHPVAAAEIARFHRVGETTRSPPAPGTCVNTLNTPQAIDGTPPGVTSPDCVNPSGCMFCTFHRDIDSADYVWSLASYRRLKVLELAGYVPPTGGDEPSPAAAVIARICQKLDGLSRSSDIRRVWVDEACCRVRERSYHPYWAVSISMRE